MSLLKQRIEHALTPLALRLPIGPNTLTLLGVLAMVAAAWAVIVGSVIVAAALILLSGFLDVLDGTLAKASGRASSWGAMLDRVADRAADALIFGSVILAGLVQLWLGLVVLSIVLIGSYASACLESATRTRVGEALSMRAVRLLILVAAFVLSGLFSIMDYAFALIALISVAALVQRMLVAKRLVAK